MSKFINGPALRGKAAEDAAKGRANQAAAAKKADANRKTQSLSKTKGDLKPGVTYTR